jgi:hypothetical protein
VFAHCSLIQECSHALVHFSKGTPDGPDPIKPLIQFYTCVCQHSYYHTLDCFDYPRKKGCNATHKCSANRILHITPQLEIHGHDIMGAKNLVHFIQLICQEMSDAEMTTHCYSSVRVHFHIVKRQMVAFLPGSDHIQL